MVALDFSQFRNFIFLDPLSRESEMIRDSLHSRGKYFITNFLL